VEKEVLFGLSFEISPGQKVALVGPAGCGKSSTIKLLQRIYGPDSGTILIDGYPIEDFDTHMLRLHVAVVSQENVLFSTTIRDNVILGIAPDAEPPTDDQVIDACKKANAWEFIQDFPNGLDTYVGDGEYAVKLSGGQKQRVAIARAIMRNPTVLLLDEATSALDSMSEKVVQAALDSLLDEMQGVSLVIAHRLTTIKNCDKIVVIDKGRKVEEGTHEELLRIPIAKGVSLWGESKTTKGLYHDLWATQMGESEEAQELRQV
jgi:ABC-type multidrug transport system fused ATPase/permease subunit